MNTPFGIEKSCGILYGLDEGARLISKLLCCLVMAKQAIACQGIQRVAGIQWLLVQ